MSLSDNVVFFIIAPLSAAASLVILVCGHLVGRGDVFAVGTCQPRRLAVEVAGLNVLLLAVTLLLARTRLLGVYLLPLASFAALLIMPLWCALRLSSNLSTALPRVTKRGSILHGIAALGLTTFAAWVLALPFLSLSFWAALFNAAQVASAVVLGFLFFRGMTELVGFTTRRRYAAMLLFKDSARIYQLRVLVVRGLQAVLGLWGIAYICYLHAAVHRGWFYLPNGFVDLASKLHLTLPYDRNIWEVYANSLPPIAIVLMGLFVARRATEQVSLLFSLLCLLYGLWGLDVFPAWCGAFFWSLHLLAWLFIAPVQLHFFLVFPHREEQLSEPLAKTWHDIIKNIYSFYCLMAPLFLHLNLNADRYSSLPRGGEPAPLFSPIVRFLVGGVGITSVPLAWLIGSYVLFATKRHLGKAYREMELTESSGCIWRDVVEGRAQNRFPLRPYLVQRQMQWVVAGVGMACLVFLVWYLVIVPFGLGKNSAMADALGKIAVALFFALSTVAMLWYWLFETSPQIKREAVWKVTLFIALGGMSWLVSLLQDWLKAVVGILFITLFYFSTSFVNPLLYRFMWKEKRNWHSQLLKAANGLTDFDATEASIQRKLEALVPPGITAGWLVKERGGTTFEIREIAHSHETPMNCRGSFEELLGNTESGLPSDFVACLDAVDDLGREARVLELVKLLEPWRCDAPPSLLPAILAKPWTRLAPWVVQLLAFRKRPGLLLSEATWLRLRTARLILAIPLGGKSVYAIYLVATNGSGDYYDRRDLAAMGMFFHEMSIVLRATGYFSIVRDENH